MALRKTLIPSKGPKINRKIFLHFEIHKTGTSSLQLFLNSRPALLADFGYLYPRSGLVYTGHHNLAWELTSDDRFDPANGSIGDLLVEIANIDYNIILSSEDFEGIIFSSQALESLLDKFAGVSLRPTMVFYHRSQDYYASSLYFELLKHGYSQGFGKFIGEIIEHGRLVFRTWRFWFDYERAICHRGETGCEYQIRQHTEEPRTNVVRDFCALADVRPDTKAASYDENCWINLTEACSLFLKNSNLPATVIDSAGSSYSVQADIGPSLRKRLAKRFNNKNKSLGKFFEKPFEIRTYSFSGSNKLEQIFRRRQITDQNSARRPVPIRTMKSYIDQFAPETGDECEWTLSGWAFVPGNRISSGLLELDGRELATISWGCSRPDVPGAFPWECPSDDVGFRAYVFLPPGLILGEHCSRFTALQ